ncbi:MAG: AraC family transcriptional regulator [Deltaproteobacteria bacterium]|jgi:AraC-like DNA-binding protein|nr:AraC family transcriptional regulator [Deltaproteobacteria bacterium]
MHATNNASVVVILWNILESYGIEPEPLFREMAMNPELMKQSGGRYRLDNIDDLWRKASEVIGDPCFGLKAGELWHPSNLGALGYAILASNTLRSAFERMDRYHRVVSDEHFMQLHETEEGLTLTLVFSHENRDIPERNDAVLALIMSMCRLNYIDDLAPVSVTLTHPQPSCSAKYFEYFRSPVVFEAAANSLTLSIDVVDKNLSSSNPQLAELSDQVMIEYLTKLEQDNITQQVKAIIIDQLPSGSVTDESVARVLHMSARKLQRQLQSAATTFSTLLNDVRLDLAQQYVRDQDISMTEIAFLLGFSESSAFSRAFKRWLGVTPSEYRQAG